MEDWYPYSSKTVSTISTVHFFFISDPFIQDAPAGCLRQLTAPPSVGVPDAHIYMDSEAVWGQGCSLTRCTEEDTEASSGSLRGADHFMHICTRQAFLYQ